LSQAFGIHLDTHGRPPRLPYNVLVTRILALAGAFILAVTVFLVYHSWPVTLLLPLAYLAICFWITRPRSASR